MTISPHKPPSQTHQLAWLTTVFIAPPGGFTADITPSKTRITNNTVIDTGEVASRREKGKELFSQR